MIAFVSDRLEARFSFVKLILVKRPISNHVPIYLQSREDVKFGKQSFKFEKIWLKEEKVGAIIKKSWS